MPHSLAAARPVGGRLQPRRSGRQSPGSASFLGGDLYRSDLVQGVFQPALLPAAIRFQTAAVKTTAWRIYSLDRPVSSRLRQKRPAAFENVGVLHPWRSAAPRRAWPHRHVGYRESRPRAAGWLRRLFAGHAPIPPRSSAAAPLSTNPRSSPADKLHYLTLPPAGRRSKAGKPRPTAPGAPHNCRPPPSVPAQILPPRPSRAKAPPGTPAHKPARAAASRLHAVSRCLRGVGSGKRYRSSPWGVGSDTDHRRGEWEAMQTISQRQARESAPPHAKSNFDSACGSKSQSETPILALVRCFALS